MLEKIALVSLGCAKNQVDSEVILGDLARNGFEITDNNFEADAIIINTCGFIEEAKEESIETIFQMAKFKERGKCKLLVVAGCLSQRYQKVLEEEIPEIDLLLGTEQWDKIGKFLTKAFEGEYVEPDFSRRDDLYSHENKRHPIDLSGYKGSAYIKIAEGCDNYCSYCAIPLIRGGYRSRTIDSIKEEAKNLANEHGVKEINLIAQETTRFGLDLYGKNMLGELLKELICISGLQWVRFLYAHPLRVDMDTIELTAREVKICPYFDLPIQHVSDRILRRMNRIGSKEEIKELIANIREKIPGVVIRTSLMVGFPGEREKDFEELLSFMEEIEFDQAGIFKYSMEENTNAAQLDEQVSQEIKDERFIKATRLQQEITKKKRSNWLGKEFTVLIDSVLEEEEGSYLGRTKYQAPEIDGSVIIPNASVKEGNFTRVRINQILENDLIGEIAYESCK